MLKLLVRSAISSPGHGYDFTLSAPVTVGHILNSPYSPPRIRNKALRRSLDIQIAPDCMEREPIPSAVNNCDFELGCRSLTEKQRR